ncbi:hypothetical protein [Sorangium sp. So ce131]|uniref:hypothetical protein n=1 Tax=Sorangium sp. So ce131 TaxID=3133282 RepID=UPI003F5DA69A
MSAARPTRKKRWSEEARCLAYALAKHAATNASFWSYLAAESLARVQETPHVALAACEVSSGWWEDYRRYKALANEWDALAVAVNGLLADRGAPPGAEDVDVFALWRELQERSSARRAEQMEAARGAENVSGSSEGGQAPPQPGPEERSRQACEPAGAARGPRGASGPPDEQRPGGAAPPPGPEVTPLDRSDADDD